MGYAPAHRLLTVVSDRKAQFARVGMRHTASLRNVLVLTALPSEAFRASGGRKKTDKNNAKTEDVSQNFNKEVEATKQSIYLYLVL